MAGQPISPGERIEGKLIHRPWAAHVRRYLHGLPDIVFSTDADGRFTYIDDKAEDLFGASSGEICGRTLLDFCAAEDEERLKGLVSTPRYHTFDTAFRVREEVGKASRVRVRAKPFVDEDGEVCGFHGLMLKCDVAADLEAQLDVARRALARKTGTIRDLHEHVAHGEKYRAIAVHMAEIAHELKQPLTIIGGFARRMAEKLGSYEHLDPETKPECFEVIQRELGRLEEMLVGLMGIARRDTVHYEEVDPNELIREVLSVNEEHLSRKSLRVDHNLDDPLGTVFLDPHLFEHVIRNLVTNAIEAAPEGDEISIRTRVIESSEPEDPAIEGAAPRRIFEMTVANGGEPIPPETIEKIFEPFYTTKSGGTGIGLTLALHIAEEHHGSIDVRSDTNGTEFTVRIPAEPEESAE